MSHDALVDEQAPTCAFRDPEGCPSARRDNDATRRTTSRQGRRDRRRVRTTDTERTRAPSVGSSRTLRPGRADVALAVHLRGVRPAPCRLLREGPAPSKAGFSPQTIQPLPAASCLASRSDQKDAPHQLLQPTNKRAPSGLSDSRAHPREPRSPHAMLSSLRPMTSSSSSGRASLDGDAPASA